MFYFLHLHMLHFQKCQSYYKTGMKKCKGKESCISCIIVTAFESNRTIVLSNCPKYIDII